MNTALLDIKQDYIFKLVFANDSSKDVLIAFLNAILKEAATEFILEHPGFCLKNAAIRYNSFFVSSDNWNLNFPAFFFALLLLLLRKRIPLWEGAVCLLSFVMVTLIPPFGLYIFRYSAPVIIFYALFSGIISFWGITWVLNQIRAYLTPALSPTEPC